MSATATATRPSGPAHDGGGPRTPVRSRRRRLIRAGIVLVALVLAAAGVWLAYFSPVLSTRQVIVHGVHTLSADQVIAAADVSLGRPMLRENLDSVARRTAALRPLESVSVKRRWPNTITINVVERRPLLAVRQPGGYLLVDRHGVAFRPATTAPHGVVIVDVNPDNVDLLTEVGTVASSFSKSFAKQVQSIKATGPDDITVILDSGVNVFWGHSADSALKAKIAAALLKQHPKTSINVSSPHNPTTR